MKPKRYFSIVVVMLVLTNFYNCGSAFAAEQDRITVSYYRWDPYEKGPTDYPTTLEFASSEEPRMVNGRVLIPLRKLAEYFNYKVDYLPESKKIELADDLGKTMELTLGQKQTTVNGRQVLLDVPADAVNGVTFVPLRFIAENFDLYVDWQASTQTVRIFEYTLSTREYILDLRTRSLMRRGNPGEPNQLLADLADQSGDWERLTMNVIKTAQGNDILMIINGHGEPPCLTDIHYFYFVRGKMVTQSLVKDSLLMYKPFDGLSDDGARVILGDGKTATVYDDLTTQVIAKYDLQELCANASSGVPIWYENNIYDIEGYGGYYLLLRGSYNCLHLVVYLDSGQVDVVYKTVFTPDEQKYFELGYADGPMGADVVQLQFEGERDGVLVFSCDLDNHGDYIEHLYKLK